MDQVFDFYKNKYNTRYLGPAEKIRVNKIIKLVGHGKRVLDVGCDIGLIGKLLLQNNNKVYGMDISPTAVKKAKKKGLKAYCLNPETQTLPFKNNYFDVVLLAEIIEHVFDPDLLLQKVRKKLIKGGELVLTTPNLATLPRRIQLLLGKNPAIENRLNKNSLGHIRYFIKDNLFKLLKDNKFKIVHFSSDLIHLSSNGKINDYYLARIFPTLGRTLIIKAIKK